MHTLQLTVVLTFFNGFCSSWIPPKRYRLKHRPERYRKNHFGGERSVYSRLLKEFDETKQAEKDDENRRLLLKYSRKYQNPQKWQPSIRKRMTSAIPGQKLLLPQSNDNFLEQNHFHEKPEKIDSTHISGMRWHPGMFMVNKRSAPTQQVDPYDEDQIGEAIDNLMLMMKQKSRRVKEDELVHSKSDHGYLDSEHLGEVSLFNFLFERNGNVN